MQKYLFDSCAMIGFFEKEKGAEKVKSILAKAALSECLVLMHNASVAEVYYDAIRSVKQDHNAILESLNFYPIKYIDHITTDTIKWMGYFKTTYKISFADSIVLAAAKLNNAKVVTSDHHEFNVIEKSGDVALNG